MIKRTLFFGNPYHISTRYEQLLITDKLTRVEKTAPIEDIGFAVFEHPQITFTQSVIQKFAANNTAIVFCDEHFLPCSMLLHLDTNQVQTERFRAQVNVSEPLKKQLWQQTVKTKILNQAAVLDYYNNTIIGGKAVGGNALLNLARQVMSGDSTNREAQASRRYWPILFGQGFIRKTRMFSEFNPNKTLAGSETSSKTLAGFQTLPELGKHFPLNGALNYGYAILRAATARALAGSGLLATLGIHHRNKYNSFCLADDIMEPYRPFVDMKVKEMLLNANSCEMLGKDEKAEILTLLTMDVLINKKTRPLMIALSETSASLSDCFEGKRKKIKYPILKI